MRPTTSPRSRVTDTSVSAWIDPKCFEMLVSSMTGARPMVAEDASSGLSAKSFLSSKSICVPSCLSADLIERISICVPSCTDRDSPSRDASNGRIGAVSDPAALDPRFIGNEAPPDEPCYFFRQLLTFSGVHSSRPV